MSKTPERAKFDRWVETTRPCPWRLETAWLAYQQAFADMTPADPMDWPLPCDVTVGHVTIAKGCRLGTLVKRMESLHGLVQEYAALEHAAIRARTATTHPGPIELIESDSEGGELA